MRTRIAIGTAIALIVQSGVVSADQPRDEEKFNADILEVIGFLEKDVVDQGDFKRFSDLRDRYAETKLAREVIPSLYREAIAGKKFLAMSKLIRYDDSDRDETRSASIMGLDSNILQVRHDAALWCIRHSKSIDAKTRNRALNLLTSEDSIKVMALERALQFAPGIKLDNDIVARAAKQIINELQLQASGSINYSVSILNTCERLHLKNYVGVVMKECMRSCTDGKYDLELATLIRASDSRDPIKEFILFGLQSPTIKLQEASVEWCLSHQSEVREEMARVRQIIIKWSNDIRTDEDRYRVSKAILNCATSEDIPLLHKLLSSYEDRFAGGVVSKYSCSDIAEDSTVKYVDFVRVLCKLGDIPMLTELVEAARQKTDSGKRAWAIAVMADLKPRGFFLAILADALADISVIPEPIDVAAPPKVSNQVARAVSVQNYTRVCDVAVRCLLEIDQPGIAAAFKAPTMKEWRVSSASLNSPENSMTVISEDGFDRMPDGGIIMRQTIGFTNDQITWTKNYISKSADKRLLQNTSGSGPKLKIISNLSVVGALRTEFIRASRLANILQIPADHNVSKNIAAGDFEVALCERIADGTNSEQLRQRGISEYLPCSKGVAIVVHPSSVLSAVTLDQLKGLLSGQLDDWKAFGGTPGKTFLYSLPNPTEASKYIVKEMLGETGQLRTDAKQRKDTADVISAVSLDPQGIGIVDLSALPNLGADMKGVKVLGIGPAMKPVSPSIEAIKSGAYPLAQPLYLYVHPKASETAKDFAAFIASGECDETFRKNGLIPLSEKAVKASVLHPATTVPAKAGTQGMPAKLK